MSVFVDTSALYALLVRTEEGRTEVSSAFGSLRDLEARIVPLLTLRWIGEALHRHSVERLLRTDRRGLSLVDCSSFVIMDSEGIEEALVLDRDFEAAAYKVIPR